MAPVPAVLACSAIFGCDDPIRVPGSKGSVGEVGGNTKHFPSLCRFGTNMEVSRNADLALLLPIPNQHCFWCLLIEVKARRSRYVC